MRYTNVRRIATTAQRDAKREITAQWGRLSEQVTAGILLAAGGDPDAPVPYSARGTTPQESALRDLAARAVHAMFIGYGQYSPFGPDGVTPLSPYAVTINDYVAKVTGEVIMGHTHWLAVSAPADVLAYLATVPSRPVPVDDGSVSEAQRRERRPEDNPYNRRADESAEDHLSRLNDIRIFSTDPPRVAYEPAHTWVDPRGYRLSDRIWNTSVEARERLDAVLTNGIRSGQSALELSRNVEQFLKPSQLHRRTRWPYDVDVSYPSMRLAITEIARSTNAAAEIAAYNNPYVQAYDIRRSPSQRGSSCTVCNKYATIDDSGARLRDPYPVGAGVNGPFHPNCMCRFEAIVEDAMAISQQIIAAGEAAAGLLQPYVTPAQPDSFAQNLLGPQLYQTMRRILGDTWKSIASWLRIR